MLLSICAIAVVLIASLAWFDVSSRRLPNVLIGLLAALYFVWSAFAAIPLTTVIAHVAVALATFVVAGALFAGGLIGGGDVKFASAVFLWAGSQLALPAFILISLAGLLIATVALVATWLVRHTPNSVPGRLALPWQVQRGVPYGVAIAFGGLLIVVVRTMAHGMPA